MTKQLLALALGVITAIGGFVDIGDVVFASQAGAEFGYGLLWILPIAVYGIMLYSEMTGRVAAVTGKTVFDTIRTMYPPKLSFATLLFSVVLTFMTCAAEIGGVALILQLLSGFSLPILIVFAVIAIGVVCWILPFQTIERIFGYMGLLVIIFLVVAIKTRPGLHTITSGLIPSLFGHSPASYWYFAVGLFTTTLMPYEIFFYSSGAIEEKWKKKDLFKNSFNSYIGYLLGAAVVLGIIVAAANTLLPLHIAPDFIGTPVLMAASSFGQVGVLAALLGLLFSIGSSTVETAFSGAYNVSQYAGWKWGKHLPKRETHKFTASWMIILVLGGALIMTGINPVELTEYAVIFSVLIMPLTFFPVLKIANDKSIMKTYANGRFTKVAGYIYLGIIVCVAVAAVPLMIVSQQGKL